MAEECNRAPTHASKGGWPPLFFVFSIARLRSLLRSLINFDYFGPSRNRELFTLKIVSEINETWGTHL